MDSAGNIFTEYCTDSGWKLCAKRQNLQMRLTLYIICGKILKCIIMAWCALGQNSIPHYSAFVKPFGEKIRPAKHTLSDLIFYMEVSAYGKCNCQAARQECQNELR